MKPVFVGWANTLPVIGQRFECVRRNAGAFESMTTSRVIAVREIRANVLVVETRNSVYIVTIEL